MRPFAELAQEAVRKEMEVNPEIHRYGQVSADNPPFSAIAQSMFYGDHGWGREMVCPRDGEKGCAFVDALNYPQKGQANLFCSWVWTYPLATFLDAFDTWATTKGYPTASTYVWICAFCNNQYRIFDEKDGSGADNLEQVFESRLNGIKRMG